MSTDNAQVQQAQRSSCRLRNLLEQFTSPKAVPHPQCLKPPPRAERLERSKTEVPIVDLARYTSEVVSGQDEKKDSVLYLAYGSNLCYETFQGKRKVRPLAQVNVVVPELRMTFDLPGIPYTEPCFANSARRIPNTTDNANLPPATNEDYHKDRWKKGMVGVVYEVTPSDYAHIIATEGGGASYQDVLVDCYALEPGVDTVPDVPKTAPFKAHTLFAPYVPPPATSGLRRSAAGRVGRADPSYAQASARYLKLIGDGAREHDFPREYMDYLDGIRPYTITTAAQRLGQFVMMTLWVPFILMYFALTRAFQDPKTGISPPWLAWLGGQIFGAVWVSYDDVFKKYFGDGERTIGDDTGSTRINGSLESEAQLTRTSSSWQSACLLEKGQGTQVSEIS